MLVRINNNKKRIIDNKTVLIHSIIGMAFFYFIFHPVTMVLYWYEFKNESITITSFFEVLKHRTLHSFSFKMLHMSVVFIVMGGIIGLAFGLYRVKNKKLTKHLNLLKQDTLNLIKQGENQFLEIKSSIRYDYLLNKINVELELVIAKTIVGFMNAKGGKLIIGVNDNGEILGLNNDFKTLKLKNVDGFEQKIYQIISNLIGKEYCLYVKVYFHEIEKKEICIIDVQKTNEPAYLNQSTNSIFYLRTGNATRPLSIKEAIHFLRMQNEN